MPDTTNKTLQTPDDQPRWKVWGCFALLMVGLYLIAGPKVCLSRWEVLPATNSAFEEALQWKKGTLALSRSYFEEAKVDGTSYNVVGLAFVILSLIGSTLTEWLGGAPGTFYPPYYVGMVALPLPIVAYWAFRTVVKSCAWAAVLPAYLIIGTSLLPVLGMCRSGSIYYINHVLAVVGLLIFAADLLGRRRIWLAAIGLGLAVWSRQMTCLYAIPLLWLAWRGPAPAGSAADGARAGRGSTRSEPETEGAPPVSGVGDRPPGPSAHGRRPLRNLWVAAACVLVIAAVPMILNTLKFGNPFYSGYSLLYEGRTGPIAQRAHREFFGPSHIKMHAVAMNLSFPSWDLRGGTLYPVTVGVEGASIWFTSPLLLGVLVTIPSWWRDRSRRVLMLGTLPVIAGLMCYHTTGSGESGYYRYSLDFIPLWLVVIAPYTEGRRGVVLTLACLAYSALYFNILPLP